MKKVIKTVIFIALSIAATGCAKVVSEGVNESKIRYFESWMKVNHPDVSPSGLGIYVLEEEIGTGVEVKEDGFVQVDYIITDLEGNISDYTDKMTAKQLGTYDTTIYYGPTWLTTIESTLQAGVADAIIGMKAGGRKKVVIPSWLMTYNVYDTAEDYRNVSTSYSNAIYDITVKDYADSIQLWEVGQIEKYIAENPQIFTSVQNDTTGFYFQSLSDNIPELEFGEDTTLYINYTGRLLNGLVFDTSVERIAKDNGLYSSSNTYGPVQINWTRNDEDDLEEGEDEIEITMGSSESTVIDGFAMTLRKMHPMEKAIGVFYSPWGYSYSGSGDAIPGYAPLIFEIEFVEKPEE